MKCCLLLVHTLLDRRFMIFISSREECASRPEVGSSFRNMHEAKRSLNRRGVGNLNMTTAGAGSYRTSKIHSFPRFGGTATEAPAAAFAARAGSKSSSLRNDSPKKRIWRSARSSNASFRRRFNPPLKPLALVCMFPSRTVCSIALYKAPPRKV